MQILLKAAVDQTYLQVGRPGKSAPAHPEVFLDNVGHFPEALAYLK